MTIYRNSPIFVGLAICTGMLAACSDRASLSVAEGTGPSPKLPPPRHSLIPTVNVVTAKGWENDQSPVSSASLTVTALATGLRHPRSLFVLPNGDVLVAETNAPKRPDDNRGIKGLLFKYFQKKAGGGVPSANRIRLLRDADGDGLAETRTVFLSGLNSPFGIALIGSNLYVANTDAVIRYSYAEGQTQIVGGGTRVTTLPAGDLNHHWTKSLIASRDGSRLYVGVGSNSNVAENGIAKEVGRAAIWEIDPSTGTRRVFASGLRNPVGMAWDSATGALWVTVNERDELGGDLVPDYMTAVREGGFYGWPYSYFGNHVDSRMEPQRPELVAKAIIPDYALGPHTASLGLASAQGNSLGPRFRSGMFVAQHGSWNRAPRSGYKVIFVPFNDGKPSGSPVDVLTGFVTPDGHAMGRPVSVAIAADGALLVTDDVGNAVWRVSAQPGNRLNPQ